MSGVLNLFICVCIRLWRGCHLPFGQYSAGRDICLKFRPIDGSGLQLNILLLCHEKYLPFSVIFSFLHLFTLLPRLSMWHSTCQFLQLYVLTVLAQHLNELISVFAPEHMARIASWISHGSWAVLAVCLLCMGTCYVWCQSKRNLNTSISETL